MRSAEEVDFGIMEEHRAAGRGAGRPIPTRPRSSSRTTGTCASGRCFHDEYLAGVQPPERHARRLPGRHRTGHRARSGRRRAAVRGRLPRLRHRVRGGADALFPSRRPRRSSAGAASPWPRSGPTARPRLFGMMSRGFPNLFIMPAPGQQAVVTVNYTQLAVLGAEFVGGAVGVLERAGRRGVRRERRGRGARGARRSSTPSWTRSAVMSACTPSRINNEGHPEAMNPRERQLRPAASATTSGTASCSTRWLDARRLRRSARRAVGPPREPERRRRSRRTVDAGPKAARGSWSSPAAAAGIGAAIAEELGPHGAFVVTMDPLVYRRRLGAAPDARGDHRRTASSPPAASARASTRR